MYSVNPALHTLPVTVLYGHDVIPSNAYNIISYHH